MSFTQALKGPRVDHDPKELAKLLSSSLFSKNSHSEPARTTRPLQTSTRVNTRPPSRPASHQEFSAVIVGLLTCFHTLSDIVDGFPQIRPYIRDYSPEDDPRTASSEARQMRLLLHRVDNLRMMLTDLSTVLGTKPGMSVARADVRLGIPYPQKTDRIRVPPEVLERAETRVFLPDCACSDHPQITGGLKALPPLPGQGEGHIAAFSALRAARGRSKTVGGPQTPFPRTHFPARSPVTRERGSLARLSNVGLDSAGIGEGSPIRILRVRNPTSITGSSSSVLTARTPTSTASSGSSITLPAVGHAPSNTAGISTVHPSGFVTRHIDSLATALGGEHAPLCTALPAPNTTPVSVGSGLDALAIGNSLAATALGFDSLAQTFSNAKESRAGPAQAAFPGHKGFEKRVNWGASPPQSQPFEEVDIDGDEHIRGLLNVLGVPDVFHALDVMGHAPDDRGGAPRQPREEGEISSHVYGGAGASPSGLTEPHWGSLSSPGGQPSNWPGDNDLGNVVSLPSNEGGSVAGQTSPPPANARIKLFRPRSTLSPRPEHQTDATKTDRRIKRAKYAGSSYEFSDPPAAGSAQLPQLEKKRKANREAERLANVDAKRAGAEARAAARAAKTAMRQEQALVMARGKGKAPTDNGKSKAMDHSSPTHALKARASVLIRFRRHSPSDRPSLQLKTPHRLGNASFARSTSVASGAAESDSSWEHISAAEADGAVEWGVGGKHGEGSMRKLARRLHIKA